jgi:hypothetical protein
VRQNIQRNSITAFRVTCHPSLATCQWHYSVSRLLIPQPLGSCQCQLSTYAKINH